MLKIALTNLGAYNEGVLRFVWLDLPCTFAAYVDALEAIGIDGVRYEEVFVSDIDTDIAGLSGYIGEYPDIEALNWLAGRLEMMAEWEIRHFEALLEAGEHTDGIMALIDLTEEAHTGDNSSFIPGVTDDDDLGRYWLEESGCYDLRSMGTLSSYIDFEAFGRDVRLEEGGVYTDDGYVYIFGGSWSDYTRDDIPDEYRLRGEEEEEDEEEEKEEVKHA